MRIFLISFTIIIASSYNLFGQEFKVVAANTNGFIYKMEADISITDSTYVMKVVGGAVDKKQVKSRTQDKIYVFDGTATDQITISPTIGKIKNQSYSHMLVYNADKNFSNTQIIFYCIIHQHQH